MSNLHKNIFLSLIVVVILGVISCTPKNKSDEIFNNQSKTTNDSISEFISIKNGQFIKNGKPYYFIGTNYWYGVSLSADTLGGDRARLIRELDFLKNKGINNLRILVGAEGPDNSISRITPTMYNQDGTINQKLIEGMDFLLDEMAKRKLYGVFYLTNNWEWSGGMVQYLNWNGYGDIPIPMLEQYDWNDFGSYHKQFYSCEPCINQLENFIEQVVSRTNSINGKKYSDDPTIMAWQLANEPRPMTEENFDKFKIWIKNTASLIKKLDKNHLVSTGNEGDAGCSDSFELFKTINTFPQIDYITIHVWIKNWKWYDYEKAEETFPQAMKKVDAYLDRHIAFANEIKKPIVLEEFGIARDNEELDPSSPTTYRDFYFEHIFNKINNSYEQSGAFAGINFWAFAGFADVRQSLWKVGDQFTGDPPQEPQGLNSVFATDTSTIKIIKTFNQKLDNVN